MFSSSEHICAHERHKLEMTLIQTLYLSPVSFRGGEVTELSWFYVGERALIPSGQHKNVSMTT